METFFVWLFHSVFKPVFWFQPCFYALHGWLATEMAIWMLFHPYEAKYVPGTRLKIPLTPGILPRGRVNLSRSIADTVTSTLLTESDIHQQAEKLVTEENLIRCIEAVLESIEREFHNTEQIRTIYRYGEEVIPGLLSQMTTGFIDNMESEQSGKLRNMLTQLLEQALSHSKIGYQQAEFMTDVLFNTLLTPPYLRKMVVDGLTEGNILLIERGVSNQVGGVKGFLVRFMGIDDTLQKLKTFFETQPAEAEIQITEMLDKLEVRERLAERISGFSFSDLSVETRSAVLGYIASIVTETLADNRAEITEAVSNWSGTASRLLINRLLQLNLKTWLNEKRPDLKQELAAFLNRYLHRELELMIGRILPVLNIGQMIVEKLEQFSNQQLEEMIYGICRRELRWLAFLGAFLGFWLGLISNLMTYWLPGLK
ncbi:MAG: hypothetical protein K0Q50_2745 [Vampirovibrio sp.]|jgi:uncharacterized membrane protein YheB (UPF0754 family)|nr:hypothetical protein [Vampirovibrio sp.]